MFYTQLLRQICYQFDVITEELAKLGVETEAFTFTDSNDVALVTQAATEYSDVLYVPTDNVAASNAEIIGNICIPAGVAVITGEESPAACGVASLFKLLDIGYKSGEMAYEVL